MVDRYGPLRELPKQLTATRIRAFTPLEIVTAALLFSSGLMMKSEAIVVVSGSWVVIKVCLAHLGTKPVLHLLSTSMLYSYGRVTSTVDWSSVSSVKVKGNTFVGRRIAIHGDVTTTLFNGRSVNRRVVEIADIFDINLYEVARAIESLQGGSKGDQRGQARI